MLGPWIEDGCVFADLFAGSGGMGIEALSRGADLVYFSDHSRESLSLVRENLAICGAESRAVLFSGDFRQNIRRMDRPVDVFFIDPPYAAGYILPALDEIAQSGALAEGGCIVCEHSSKDELPEEYAGFKVIKDRRYGAAGITVYAAAAEEEQS